MNRYAWIRLLVGWLWFVAVAAGVGGGIGIYYAARSLGGAGATFLAIVSGFVYATPFLGVIAFLNMTEEIAQGVTWITAFLHDHEA